MSFNTHPELLCTVMDEVNMYGLNIHGAMDKNYTYPAVSVHKNDVLQLMDRFTNDGISHVHYDDIIRDFILESAYDLIEANGIKPF